MGTCGGCGKARANMKKLVKSEKAIRAEFEARDEKRKNRAEVRRERIAKRNLRAVRRKARIAKRNKGN